MITVNNVKPDQTYPLDLGLLFLFRLSIRIFRVNKVPLPGYQHVYPTIPVIDMDETEQIPSTLKGFCPYLIDERLRRVCIPMQFKP